MKLLWVLLAMLCVSVGWAAEKSAHPQKLSVAGKVLEVKDVDSYTYLRLQTKEGETWAAVAKTPVKKGAEVTVVDAMVMRNFESKALNRKFDRIIFGVLGATRPDLAAMHSSMAKPVGAGDIHVPKASGPNARTVAEIVTKRSELKGKTVVVRGKVVKYTRQVLGRNWIHLRDGSGSATDRTNDIVVTTKDQARVGDVVVAQGVVHTDKNLGAGYTYKVLIEEASLQK